MTREVDLGACEDFAEGELRIVEIDAKEFGVARWNGKYFAMRNICPHQSAPLCRGRLLPDITASAPVGMILADSDRAVVTCPWHGWEFRLETGQSVWNTRYRVRSYELKVKDGRVLVELSR